MKSTRSKLRISISLLFVIVVLGILFIILKNCTSNYAAFYKKSNVSEAEFNAKKNKYDHIYSHLFTQNARSKIKLSDTKITKTKHGFLSYGYDNYAIIVHMVSLKADVPLKNLIILEKSKTDGWMGFSKDKMYSGYEDFDVSFLFCPEHDSMVNKIYLAYVPDFISKTEFGDSIITYNFQMEELSLRYEKKAAADFILKCVSRDKSNNKLINMSVTFYKKGNNVFFIILYPGERNEVLDSSFIPRLLGIDKR